MLAGTFEASVAGADDALARAALGSVPRDSFDEAGAVCPPLLLLPQQDVVRLLLAPTPEVALDQHWPRGWFFGPLNTFDPERPGGGPVLVLDENKTSAIAMLTPCGMRATVQPPLLLSSWNAGAALWLNELFARLSASMRAELNGLLAGDTNLILASLIESESATHCIGSRQVRRLAARVRFTRFVDGVAGGGAEPPQVGAAGTWLAAERLELVRMLDGRVIHPNMRKLANYLMRVVAELDETLEAVRAHLQAAGGRAATARPPLVALRQLRASHDAESGRAYLRWAAPGWPELCELASDLSVHLYQA
jgi:hypothetical protein